MLRLFFCLMLVPFSMPAQVNPENTKQTTDSILPQLFYGLDFSLPQDSNATLLSMDERFNPPALKTKKVSLWLFQLLPYAFYGSTNAQSHLQTPADSAVLFLINDIGLVSLSHPRDSIKSVHYSIYRTTLTYHYHTPGTLDKAYQELVDFLISNGKTPVDTNDWRDEPCSQVTFEDGTLVEPKTLIFLKRETGLVHWPVLSIKKRESVTCELEITFEQQQLR